jgi:hypothetical protein
METINPNTRIIDLTVAQLMELLEKQPFIVVQPELPKKRLVYGIVGIAQLFNCSMATANRIKASGKINRAISQYGRMITIDADLALELIKRK